MKYWVFQNNQVNGPYEPDDLSQLPGYSAESLVCPEGRKGTSMGDWQRAGMVPAMALSLVKATQLAAVGKGAGPGMGRFDGLPPEPTLKDLAALGSLQEKVTLIENAVARFQEGLEAKETELLSLHRELDVRKSIEADLHGKLRELEERLAAVAKLRETIDSAVAAEKSVETEVKGVESAVHEVETSMQEVKSSVSGVRTTVHDLESSLESQRKTIHDLMSEIEHIKTEQKAPPPAPAPVPAPSAPPPAGMAAPVPGAAPLSPPPAAAPLQINPPPPSAANGIPPMLQPAPAAGLAPAPLFPGQDAPAPIPFSGTQETSAFTGLPAISPFELAIPPAGTQSTQKGAASEPAFTDIAAPEAKPRSGKGFLVLVALLALCGGGWFAIQNGLIPGLKPPTPPAQDVVLPPPEAELTAQAPSPEAQLEQAKRQAIALVEGWPTADRSSSVAQRLPAQSGPRGLSPWMAEQLRDGVFQVNFYGGKSADGKKAVYEFQANLSDMSVAPLNASAKTLLTGEAASAKARKVRVKPKRAELPGDSASPLDSPLGLGPDSAPAAAAGAPPAADEAAEPAPKAKAPKKTASQKAAEERAQLDELLMSGSNESAPAQARPVVAAPAAPAVDQEEEAPPPPKAKGRAPKASAPAQGADDAQLLDDLLAP